MSGVFVTFEGCEGCGKSTQIRRLAESLEAAGIDVLVTREPGGTSVGDAIREVVLGSDLEEMDYWTELLLYEASRAELVSKVIRPALSRGLVVLCDRFVDSTVAYQGYGRGLSMSDIESLNRIATRGLLPVATVLLDIPPIEGLNRYEGEKKGIPQRQMSLFSDRIERQDLAFHETVRHGFLAIAREHPNRVRVIDALGTPDEVADRVAAALRDVPSLSRALGG